MNRARVGHSLAIVTLLVFASACRSPGIPAPSPMAVSQCGAPVSADLSIITWNINKRDAGNDEIDLLITACNPDILCLQEATSNTCTLYEAAFKSCLFAPSWEMCNGQYTGVLTASRFEIDAAALLRAPDLEFFLFTPKAATISTLDLPSGEKLMVINVHALNFVPIGLLENQLEELYRVAVNHTGPMIACGDFNTWNSPRLKAAHQFAARLGMVEALAYHEHGGTPSYWAIPAALLMKIDFGAPLDRIFCRGFEVVSCTRLSGFDSSDHIPVLLKVRYLR